MLNKNNPDNKEIRTIFVPAPAKKLNNSDYWFILNIVNRIIDMLIIWVLIIR